MDEYIGRVHALKEIPLVGVVDQSGRYAAQAVGNHAVGGDNGITDNAQKRGHEQWLMRSGMTIPGRTQSFQPLVVDYSVTVRMTLDVGRVAMTLPANSLAITSS